MIMCLCVAYSTENRNPVFPVGHLGCNISPPRAMDWLQLPLKAKCSQSFPLCLVSQWLLFTSFCLSLCLLCVPLLYCTSSMTLHSCWVTLVPPVWAAAAYSKPGYYHYGNALMLFKETCWWDLCAWGHRHTALEINLYSYVIVFSLFGYNNFFLSHIFSPLLASSPSISGQCDLFLHWTHFCCHDVHQPPELPLVAEGDRAIINGHVSGASVPDLEQGGLAADLWSPEPRGCGLAVPEQSRAPSSDPQSWQSAAGAHRRSARPLTSNMDCYFPAPALLQQHYCWSDDRT